MTMEQKMSTPVPITVNVASSFALTDDDILLRLKNTGGQHS